MTKFIVLNSFGAYLHSYQVKLGNFFLLDSFLNSLFWTTKVLYIGLSRDWYRDCIKIGSTVLLHSKYPTTYFLKHLKYL